MSFSLAHALGQMSVSASGFHTFYVKDQWDPAAVQAGQARLLVVLQGRGELVSRSVRTPVAAGQMMVFGCDSQVQFRASSADGDGLLIAQGVIAATLLNGQCVFDFITLPYRVDLGDSDLFVSAVPELLRESSSEEAGSDSIVNCLVRRIVTFALRDAWPDSALVPVAAPSHQGAQLQKIVEAMKKDPARQFTLESLSDMAGMSRTAFHKMFIKSYGKSPLAMLTSIRMKKAEELLIYTDLPIKSISARLGYRSRSYFWLTFKKAYGTDPESYRSAHAPGSAMAGEAM
jgi:AraC-like DNA-binding protein